MARNVIVSVEFQIVERRSNAKPARHGCSFNASDASFADDDDITSAHRPTDEDDLKLDLSVEADLARTEEEDAAGTDVARDQSDWEIFATAVYATEAQGKTQRSSRILALFGKDADGMRWDAGEPPHGVNGF